MLGPSGCGKTTLLRLIAGFETPDQGTIFFDGVDVSKVPVHERGIGMVFQSYALWPHMSVAENLSFGLEMHGLAKIERGHRVAETLVLVRMEGYEARYPHELSGGQQQRIALARALALKPKLVLLDEPLSNLDARLRLDIRDEIVCLHRTLGITMVYVTHDQQEVLSMAQRAALMRDGAILQCSDPRTLYERPVTRYAASFFGDANFFHGVVRETSGGMVLAISDKFYLPLIGNFSLGATLTLLVRPEAFVVKEAGSGMMQVSVRDLSYFGSGVRVSAQTDGGPEIVLHLPGSMRDIRVGEVLEISCASKDMVVLED